MSKIRAAHHNSPTKILALFLLRIWPNDNWSIERKKHFWLKISNHSRPSIIICYCQIWKCHTLKKKKLPTQPNYKENKYPNYRFLSSFTSPSARARARLNSFFTTSIERQIICARTPKLSCFFYQVIQTTTNYSSLWWSSHTDDLPSLNTNKNKPRI